MRTLVFPVKLNSDQESLLANWLETLRQIWNQGLELLIELDRYGQRYPVPIYTRLFALLIHFGTIPDNLVWMALKLGKARTTTYWRYDAGKCPIAWNYRYIKDMQWCSSTDAIAKADQYAPVPYSSMATKKPYRPYCPIQPSTSEPIEFISRDPTVIRWLHEEGISPVAQIGDPLILEAIAVRPVRSHTLTLPAICDTPVISAIYRITPPRRHDPFRQPRLPNDTFFALSGYFAQKRHPDWQDLKEIPASLVRGTLHKLAIAWDRHKKSPRTVGLPKFKKKNDGIQTITLEDAKSVKVRSQQETVKKRYKQHGKSPKKPGKLTVKSATVTTSYITLSKKFGEIRVPRFASRWGTAKIRVVQLTIEPTGYSLQVTGDAPKRLKKSAGYEAGVALPMKQGILYADSTGRLVEAAPEDLKLLRRLERLQQALAQKTYGSNRWLRTKNKIARIHRTLRLRAKNRNQKQASFLLRRYHRIVLQKVKPGHIPRPEPIPTDPMANTFANNGAAQVSRVNAVRTELRVGQFVALIQQAAKERNAIIEIVESDYSGDTDPVTIAQGLINQSSP